MRSPLAVEWIPLEALWECFRTGDNVLARLQIGADPSTWQPVYCGQVAGDIARRQASDGGLLLAAVTAGVGQEQGTWRAAFLLDGLYQVQGNFVSRLAAHRAAEETLASALRGRESLPGVTSAPVFAQPVEEILSMLLVILDGGWQVASVSAYPGLWVALCVNDARTAVLDLVFRDDFRERGPQLPLERGERSLLDQAAVDLSAHPALSISDEIRRTVAARLLEKRVPFSMRQLDQHLYQVTVPAEHLTTLQTIIGEREASGLVDDDDVESAWFRSRGALISYTFSQPGYTAEYHYRYETPGMSGPGEFDVRDLSTLHKPGGDHQAAICAAIDGGELNPGASFLVEPCYAAWE
jgi:hypothetical protein